MSELFQKVVALPVSASEAFAWHARPGALERLIPPWEQVRVLNPGSGIEEGSVGEMSVRIGPARVKWVARHSDCQVGRRFRDSQIAGPFARWEHSHEFDTTGSNSCVLTDRIEYDLPCGAAGRLLGSRFVRRKIDAMFTYRHTTTRDDLTAHARFADLGIRHIAVTGASGLIGSTLVPMLTTGGHRVTRLVRGVANEGEVNWDPQGSFDAAPLDGVDAVIHLAGVNIASARWSGWVKARIRASRVRGTEVLCQALARLTAPPKVLVCASASGIYGDRGDERLTERSAPGTGFLADVGKEWEQATLPAAQAGIRVVHLRFGMVLSPRAGALSKLLPPFQMGGGGRIGSGRQFWSWISIDDAIGAIHHALMTESLAGPVNAVAPAALTNAEFTRALGTIINRPTILPLPAFAIRLGLGEMADELLLASARVEPLALQQSGYEFRQPTLESALRHVLGR